jgi:hypothetical protein
MLFCFTAGASLRRATTKKCDRASATSWECSMDFFRSCTVKNPSGRPPGPPPAFDEILERAKSSHAGLRQFAATLNPDMISSTVHVPWFPDPPCIITIAEALVQVAMHTQHHRGQCMTRLRDLGGEPKNVDWILWLWKQKPETRWA